MRQIREHRKMSRADVAKLHGVSTIASTCEDAAQMREASSEYKPWKGSLSKRDCIGQRLQSDPLNAWSSWSKTERRPNALWATLIA
jgi:hypothetical protein